jgi:hypothetical protein
MAAAAVAAQLHHGHHHEATRKKSGRIFNFLLPKSDAPEKIEDATEAKVKQRHDSAVQDSGVHNRFLADRERELARFTPLERFARFLGWHPRKVVHNGGSATIRASIEKHQKENQHVLDPRSSTFVNNWDLVILILLIFTMLVTPYEVPPAPRRQTTRLRCCASRRAQRTCTCSAPATSAHARATRRLRCAAAAARCTPCARAHASRTPHPRDGSRAHASSSDVDVRAVHAVRDVRCAHVHVRWSS